MHRGPPFPSPQAQEPPPERPPGRGGGLSPGLPMSHLPRHWGPRSPHRTHHSHQQVLSGPHCGGGQSKRPDSRTQSHQGSGCGQAVPTEAGRQCLGAPCVEATVPPSPRPSLGCLQGQRPGVTQTTFICAAHPRESLVGTASSCGEAPRTCTAWRDPAPTPSSQHFRAQAAQLRPHPTPPHPRRPRGVQVVQGGYPISA